MKKILKNLIKKINLLIILFTLSNLTNAKSEIYSEINVTGNERISIETVIMFSGLKTGVDLNVNQINDAIKKLYKTDYFKNIDISTSKNTININVIENPIIQSIVINGIENKELLKNLREITKKSEKYPYLKNRLKAERDLLLNVVRANGFYFAKIQTKLLNNNNNSVDVFYEFELGSRAIIKKINFNGQKIFRDTKLRNIIQSEEGKFWKFISSNKYFDEIKIKNDEKLLKKFYKNKGYYNVKIKSSYAKNINNKFFELTFNIDAGEKYFFNEFKLNFESNLNDENLKKIDKITKKLKDEKFSEKELKKLLENIDKIAL